MFTDIEIFNVGDNVRILQGYFFKAPLAGTTGTITEIVPNYYESSSMIVGDHGYRVKLSKTVEGLSYIMARGNELEGIDGLDDLSPVIGARVIIGENSTAISRRGMLGYISDLSDFRPFDYEVTFADLSTCRFGLMEFQVLATTRRTRQLFLDGITAIREAQARLVRQLITSNDRAA